MEFVFGICSACQRTKGDEKRTPATTSFRDYGSKSRGNWDIDGIVIAGLKVFLKVLKVFLELSKSLSKTFSFEGGFQCHD